MYLVVASLPPPKKIKKMRASAQWGGELHEKSDQAAEAGEKRHV